MAVGHAPEIYDREPFRAWIPAGCTSERCKPHGRASCSVAPAGAKAVTRRTTRRPATERRRKHGQCSRRTLDAAESARAADAEHVRLAQQRILAGSTRVWRRPKRGDTHDARNSAGRRRAECERCQLATWPDDDGARRGHSCYTGQRQQYKFSCYCPGISTGRSNWFAKLAELRWDCGCITPLSNYRHLQTPFTGMAGARTRCRTASR